MAAEHGVNELLRKAGVTVNGKNPWDLTVHNPQFYSRVLREGTLGLGESYMDGWWDCENIPELIYKVHRADLYSELKKQPLFLAKLAWYGLVGRIFNFSSKRRAFEIGERHYDIGNDLYEKMLDKRMIYSCGYWKNAQTLDEAQEHKLDLICRKLDLKPGETLLDIGCGWGGLLQFAAEHYGVKGVGVSVSKEQIALAKERTKGLPIEFRLQDYRDLSGKYKKIVSVGMFEHVGYKNYATFMQKVTDLLEPDGTFLLHTIGSNTTVARTDPWIEKYIFPNSMLPSIAQIGKSIEERFIMEDWHNFGPDYGMTLAAWSENFEKAWPALSKKYGARFYRMWHYYLETLIGSFRAREIELWQIVLRKKNSSETYHSPR